MATISDVARLAGVSVPTVSRVLNRREKVGEDLVARVDLAIAELQYRPSRTAQRMRSQNRQLVGIALSDIGNPFYINVLKGIEHVLSNKGMSLLVSNADSDDDREASLIELMRAEDAAGLIIAPTSETSAPIKEAATDGFPIVVFDRQMRNSSVDTVYADGFRGACRAVSHLAAHGHKRIGVITGPLHLSSAKDRYAGYLQAMSDAGLTADPSLTRFGDYRLDSGHDLARELIDGRNPPTALFVANNQMTIGALNAIHETGLRMPDDIAFVGFDEFDWAISLNPPLTTVAQSAFEVGRRSASLLLERIDDPSRPVRTVVLETELKIRASCGGPVPAAPTKPHRRKAGSKTETSS